MGNQLESLHSSAEEQPDRIEYSTSLLGVLVLANDNFRINNRLAIVAKRDCEWGWGTAEDEEELNRLRLMNGLSVDKKLEKYFYWNTVRRASQGAINSQQPPNGIVCGQKHDSFGHQARQAGRQQWNHGHVHTDGNWLNWILAKSNNCSLAFDRLFGCSRRDYSWRVMKSWTWWWWSWWGEEESSRPLDVRLYGPASLNHRQVLQTHSTWFIGNGNPRSPHI